MKVFSIDKVASEDGERNRRRRILIVCNETSMKEEWMKWTRSEWTSVWPENVIRDVQCTRALKLLLNPELKTASETKKSNGEKNLSLLIGKKKLSTVVLLSRWVHLPGCTHNCQEFFASSFRQWCVNYALI